MFMLVDYSDLSLGTFAIWFDSFVLVCDLLILLCRIILDLSYVMAAVLARLRQNMRLSHFRSRNKCFKSRSILLSSPLLFRV